MPTRKQKNQAVTKTRMVRGGRNFASRLKAQDRVLHR